MPRTAARNGGFRVNRASVFCTYSDAAAIVTAGGKLFICEFICGKWPAALYLIGEETHPTTGEPHFHVVIKFGETIDTSNPRFLDIAGIHPFISPGRAGAKSESYSAKEGNILTNYYEPSTNPWSLAADAANLNEGLKILWKSCAKEMLNNGERIEANLAKKLKPAPPPMICFFGPFPETFYPPSDWNRDTHSLLILGPAGIGKTQFARYFFGEYEYFKSHPERLRDATWTKPLILDEFNYLTRDQEQSKEITDIMSGGTLDVRYRPIVIPPGVPRIFLSNFRCFRNPDNAVYDRRCKVIDLHPPVIELEQFA